MPQVSDTRTCYGRVKTFPINLVSLLGVTRLRGFAPLALGPQFHREKPRSASKPAKICYFNRLLKCFAQLRLCSFHFLIKTEKAEAVKRGVGKLQREVHLNGNREAKSSERLSKAHLKRFSLLSCGLNTSSRPGYLS